MLKAVNKEDISDGIIISFHSKWQSLLMSSSVNCIFRKRGPRQMIPRWIYVYVATPIKALTGRLPVKKVEIIPIKECVNYTSKGAITEEQLVQYANDYKELFVFHVGKYQSAVRNADFAFLSSHYKFSPPQSFLLLSKQGKRIINDICGF